MGRWISRDPITEFGGNNLYSFVKNDPVLDRDSRGLKGGIGKIVTCPAFDYFGPGVPDAGGAGYYGLNTRVVDCNLSHSRDTCDEFSGLSGMFYCVYKCKQLTDMYFEGNYICTDEKEVSRNNDYDCCSKPSGGCPQTITP